MQLGASLYKPEHLSSAQNNDFDVTLWYLQLQSINIILNVALKLRRRSDAEVSLDDT